ncbi:MAG: c-type cytochrome [Planctomycetota bacterium]
MKIAFAVYAAVAGVAFTATGDATANEELAKKYNCLACHSVEQKVVGPSYKDIAKKYANDASAAKTLEGKVKGGSTGVWGPVPMPPNNVPDADNKALVAWILSLK